MVRYIRFATGGGILASTVAGRPEVRGCENKSKEPVELKGAEAGSLSSPKLACSGISGLGWGHYFQFMSLSTSRLYNARGSKEFLVPYNVPFASTVQAASSCLLSALDPGGLDLLWRCWSPDPALRA